MGVYIPNMEMPKTCFSCSFNDGLFCSLIDNDSDALLSDDPVEEVSTSRLYACPLIEIPTPHGRLIDEGTFICRMDDSFRMAGLNGADYRKVKRWLKNARTILEAEERDDQA